VYQGLFLFVKIEAKNKQCGHLIPPASAARPKRPGYGNPITVFYKVLYKIPEFFNDKLAHLYEV